MSVEIRTTSTCYYFLQEWINEKTKNLNSELWIKLVLPPRLDLSELNFTLCSQDLNLDALPFFI